MRAYMRKREVLGQRDTATVQAAGMTIEDVEDMYRLLAIGSYHDRYVVPKAHAELGERLMQQVGTCGLDFEGGPGNCGMVVPESDADNQRFMLTEEPAELDIVKMAGRLNEKDQ
jgi:nitrate reductase beta subunit